MPYIKQERRSILELNIMDLAETLKSLPNSNNERRGDLNYVICRLVNELFPENKYTEISDGIAALNDAAAEIRRRRLDVRENQAIEINGDIIGFGNYIG